PKARSPRRIDLLTQMLRNLGRKRMRPCSGKNTHCGLVEPHRDFRRSFEQGKPVPAVDFLHRESEPAVDIQVREEELVRLGVNLKQIAGADLVENIALRNPPEFRQSPPKQLRAIRKR